MFAGFWCKRCGGRIFQDEPYINNNKQKIAVLTCLLCARSYQVEWYRYQHLLNQIENAIYKKRSVKKEQILSRQDWHFSPSYGGYT